MPIDTVQTKKYRLEGDELKKSSTVSNYAHCRWGIVVAMSPYDAEKRFRRNLSFALRNKLHPNTLIKDAARRLSKRDFRVVEVSPTELEALEHYYETHL